MSESTSMNPRLLSANQIHKRSAGKRFLTEQNQRNLIKSQELEERPTQTDADAIVCHDNLVANSGDGFSEKPLQNELSLEKQSYEDIKNYTQ